MYKLFPAEQHYILWLDLLPWTTLYFFLELIIALVLCLFSVFLSQTYSPALSLSVIHLFGMVSHMKKTYHFHLFLGHLHPGGLDSPAPIRFWLLSGLLPQLFPESHVFLFFVSLSHLVGYIKNSLKPIVLPPIWWILDWVLSSRWKSFSS